MPDYLHPGVYVEEIAAPPSVGRMETDVAGFVGPTAFAGAGGGDLTGVPTSVTGLADFERLFGGAGPSGADGTRLFVLHESVRLYFQNGGRRCVIVSTGGFTDADGVRTPRAREFRKGIRALRKAPEAAFFATPDAALLPRPRSWAKVARAALGFARKHGRFAIIDVRRGDRAPGGADDPVDGPRGLRALIDGDARSWGAAYWPWLEMPDGSAPVPPGGAVAGAFARTDVDRGVWKAPANVDLRGVAGLTTDVSRPMQEGLNAPDKAVNAIRAFSGRGIRIWGARTLAGGEYRYVAVRRTALMIERSLADGLRFALFEPAAPATWTRVRAVGGAFLDSLWRSGAFAGARPDEAYFIRCGPGDTMGQADLDAGRIVVLVGVALVRPAEFVILRIALEPEE